MDCPLLRAPIPDESADILESIYLPGCYRLGREDGNGSRKRAEIVRLLCGRSDDHLTYIIGLDRVVHIIIHPFGFNRWQTRKRACDKDIQIALIHRINCKLLVFYGCKGTVKMNGNQSLHVVILKFDVVA